MKNTNTIVFSVFFSGPLTKFLFLYTYQNMFLNNNNVNMTPILHFMIILYF